MKTIYLILSNLVILAAILYIDWKYLLTFIAGGFTSIITFMLLEKQIIGVLTFIEERTNEYIRKDESNKK